MIRRSEGGITGVRGLRLAYRTWEAPQPRAALIVVHGFGEHSGRYAEFGERMAGYGISTFALDLRGHGLSEGRRGHVRSFDIFLQELDRFRREVEGICTFRTPLFLLGHSMGGLIAIRYQEEYSTRFSGAIIVSPWLATAVPVPRWKAMAASALNRVAPALPMKAGINADHVSRDPAIVAAYRGDPLVHDTMTPRFFSEISAAMGLALQRSERIQQPLLYLVAGDDRLVDAERSLRFARSITRADITIKVYPGYYHELLNELERSLIYAEVRDWIAART